MKINVVLERIGSVGSVTITPSVAFNQNFLGEYLLSDDCEGLRREIEQSAASFRIVQEWDTERVMEVLARETKHACGLTQIQRYFLLVILSSLDTEAGDRLVDSEIWPSYSEMVGVFSGSGRYLRESEKQEIYEIVAGEEASV